MSVTVDFRVGRDRSGVVTIAAPDQPTVEIEDEIWHQLAALCHACAEALAGRGATIRYFEMFGGYALQPDGAAVVIAGDELPTARFDARELATAIAACARRYIDEATATGDPDTLALRDVVAAALAEL